MGGARRRAVLLGAVLAGAVALAVAVVVWVAPAPSPPEPPAPTVPPRDYNVVLLLVDTLRADHLSGLGYGRPTSPNLDAFAASGVVFEQARSQAACTFPSANSILTSRYPAHFLGQPQGRLGIPEGVPSLAEILKARGYATVALSASPIVRKSPSRFNPGGDFDRGFDFFGEGCVWRSALCLHQRLMQHLPTLPRPFFLYLHYMEPHGPYRPPAVHTRRFAGEYRGPNPFIADGDPNPIAEMLYRQGEEVSLAPGDLDHLVDLYDDEIAFFDHQFGVLLRLLEQAGALEDTLIALVADHGEEFLEHNHIKHCRTPYDTQVKTPLILRVPGGPEGLRLTPAVENVDVVPTLLDYMGVDLSAYAFEGKSLRPWIEGWAEEGGELYAFSAQAVWRSVTDGRYKLIYHMGKRRFELYDLAADPGETENVLAEHREEFQRLRRALYEWLVRVEGGAASEKSLEAARQTEQQLRALGYLQ